MPKLTKKPLRENTPSKTAEDSVQTFIELGGGVPHSRKKNEKKTYPVLLKPPTNIITRIDELLASNDIPQSRHNWILQAILEKLEHEER